MSAKSSLIIPQNPMLLTILHVGKFEVGYFWDYKNFMQHPHIILLTLSCSLARVRERARFLLFLYSFFSSFFLILSFGSFLSFSSFSFFSFSFSSFLAFVYNCVGGQFFVMLVIIYTLL